MTAIVEFLISAPSEPWESIGLTVSGGVAQVGTVRLRFVPGDEGVIGWGIAGAPIDVDSIEGLPTFAAPESGPAPTHAMDVNGFDHIIVTTTSIERTSGEIERCTGEGLRRIREAGPIRQGFHRIGEVIVEVVQTDRVTDEHAHFGGLVINVNDIDALCERLGLDVISEPRVAVQPGRRIASIRRTVGLGVPVAIMTPPVPWVPEPDPAPATATA
jgi:hypothetical protein